jgi:diguanylate cyclase
MAEVAEAPRSPLVMIVDDDDSTRWLAREALVAAGFEVIEAIEGNDALQQQAVHRPDALLLDLNMPGLDGYEVCRRIRQRAAGSITPILVMAAKDDVEEIARAFAAGATDFLLKPLHLPLLAHRVRYTLRAAAAFQEVRDNAARLGRAQRLAAKLAYFDEETRLPNREFLRRYLARTVDGPGQAEGLLTSRGLEAWRPLAVISIDLGITRIKDSLAAPALAVLLAAIERVAACAGGAAELPRGEGETSVPEEWVGDALVARVGDDELTVVVRGRDFAASAMLGRQLAEALSTGLIIADSEVSLAASLGLACYPDPVREAREVAGSARVAMVHGRDLGRSNLEIFDAELERRGRRRMEISHLLHRAVGRLNLRHRVSGGELATRQVLVPAISQEPSEFRLHYQPKIDPSTGTLAGVEALLRWSPTGHPDITPDEFIPIAETTGSIVPIGEWVLREACAQGARWIEKGIPLRVAVNVSARQLREPRFVSTVVRAAAAASFPPTLLELEITEHVTMHDFDHAVTVLHELRQLGVQIALDDFGIGYSSLSYLSRLPIDSLKIDRSFILPLGKSASAEAIPIAIIAMANSLGLRVVAEGVETVAQAEFLDRQGACELQGFLFARPMPAAELDRLMSTEAHRLLWPPLRRRDGSRRIAGLSHAEGSEARQPSGIVQG